MNLYEKIMKIYPDLTGDDFMKVIRLQNESNGKGAYIAMWEHPKYKKPTKEELDKIN